MELETSLGEIGYTAGYTARPLGKDFTGIDATYTWGAGFDRTSDNSGWVLLPLRMSEVRSATRLPMLTDPVRSADLMCMTHSFFRKGRRTLQDMFDEKAIEEKRSKLRDDLLARLPYRVESIEADGACHLPVVCADEPPAGDVSPAGARRGRRLSCKQRVRDNRVSLAT